jgi:hypothetical protein
MTAERVNAECRNGHTHTYPGPAGRAVKCRDCRVSVWLKKGQARPVDGTTAPALTALWALEAPPGQLLDNAEVAPETCLDCGGECVWEGRRTVLYCPECDQFAVPAFVVDRYDQRAGGGDSDDQGKRLELAVPEPSPAERRQATARLEGHRETTLDTVRQTMDALDVDDLGDSQARREALRWRGAMGSYATAVRAAKTSGELAEIENEIIALLPQYRQVAENIRQERERQELAAHYLEAEEWEEEEDEQPPDPSPVVALVPANFPTTTIGLAGMVAKNLAISAQRRREQKSENGVCQYWHRFLNKSATHVTYPGDYRGTRLRADVEIRTCPEHLETAADALIKDGWQHAWYEEI